MAKSKKRHIDRRKLFIQFFAITLCALMVILAIVSSYYMIKG